MQTFDIVILGAGLTGTHIARQLATSNLKVAVVALPHKREDYLQQVVAVISDQAIPHDRPAALDNVTLLNAQTTPTFLGERRISVNEEEINFKLAVLAMGAHPRPIDRLPNAITPIDLFQLAEAPNNVTAWGAGPVGICVALKLIGGRSSVRLMSKHDRVLPHEDATISNFVADQLKKVGVTIETELNAPAETDANVLCAGLQPNTEGLNLKNALVYTDEHGRVKTDEQMRTSSPYVYAAGAVTAAPHQLSYERFQADLVAENIQAAFFMKHRCMPEPFPSVIPFSPALARVGLTEDEANRKFKDAVTVTQNFPGGLIKLVALKRSGLLVGAHMAGSGADGLVLFFDLLMRAEIPLRDVLERHHFPSSPQSEATAQALENWIELAGR